MHTESFPSFLKRVDCFPIVGSDGSVFMRRFRLLRTRWGNLYLHQFLRGDEDRCFHDHPWSFVTLILCGGYSEEMPNGSRWRSPGTLLYRPATHRHRVECSKPAWSLVFVRPKSRAWGFWTKAGWRQWLPGQPRPVCEDV